MSKFNPDKLTTLFKDGASPTSPIIPRRYTLTHSDETADLFLTIGTFFDTAKITAMRDEVLAEWKQVGNQLSFNVYLHVDSPTNAKASAIRDQIFRRELPLALAAIRYGDRFLFLTYPVLDTFSILVHFQSENPAFNKIENWGTFTDYT